MEYITQSMLTTPMIIDDVDDINCRPIELIQLNLIRL